MRDIVTLLLLAFAFNLNARQVNIEEASIIASEFFRNLGPDQHFVLSKPNKLNKMSVTNDTEPFYVFNNTSNNGFIIVSGDNRTEMVLGYSDNGNIDINHLPPQLEYLLEKHTEKINSLDSGTPVHYSWNKLQLAKESVVLKTADWSQGAPYNKYCPEIDGQKCLTGCVATAMAIVMKYHNWPSIGRGNHTLPCTMGFDGSNEVAFDFETTFDFEGMSEVNDDNISSDSHDAIAKLMLAAGASCHTNYGLDASGASSSNVSRALIYNLRYSPEITEIESVGSFSPSTLDHFYSKDEFEGIIKQQIEEGFPVLGTTWNHMLVIDGISTDDSLYHINWGWGGSGNGFYSLANEYVTGAIINIKPDKSEVNISEAHMRDNDFSGVKTLRSLDYSYPWLNISTSNVKNGEPFDIVSGNIYFPSTFNGCYGVAIIDENNRIKEILRTEQFQSNGYEQSRNIDYSNVIPTTDIYPTDRVQIVTKADNSDEWALVMSTRQTSATAPCQGFIPKFAHLKWNKFGDIEIQNIKIADNLKTYNTFPDKLLKGSKIEISFAKSFDIWHLDSYTDYLVMNINGKSRDVLQSDNERLFLMDDEAEIKLYSFPSTELHEANIFLKSGERIESKLTPEEANKISSLTVSGTINMDDLDYIDKAFPFLRNINLKNCEMETESIIPVAFHRMSYTLEKIILPINVKKIDRQAFSYTNIKSIYLPKTIETIEYESFSRNFYLSDVWVENPIYDFNNLSNAAFWESSLNECTLHVPFDEIEACKEHTFWSKFGNIEGFIPGKIVNISFTDNKLEMKIGEEQKITPVIVPDFVDNEKLIWESCDANIATVNENGLIKAASSGNTTITATTQDGSDIVAKCEVSVVNNSGVEDTVASKIALNVKGLDVVMEGLELGVQIKVYGVNGLLINSFVSDSSSHKFTLNSRGIYIVTIGDRAFKVMI